MLMLIFSLAAQAQNNLPDAPAKADDVPAPLTATTPTESTGKTVVFHKKIFGLLSLPAALPGLSMCKCRMTMTKVIQQLERQPRLGLLADGRALAGTMARLQLWMLVRL